jgi:ribosome biogenesis protein SSF1/2
MTIENTVNVSSLNISEHQRAVKLSEIGPRIEMKLMKIQEGFCEGNVIYHAYMEKTKEQVKETGARIKKRTDEKMKRKMEQDANVEKKKKAKKGRKAIAAPAEEEEESAEEFSEDDNFM